MEFDVTQDVEPELELEWQEEELTELQFQEIKIKRFISHLSKAFTLCFATTKQLHLLNIINLFGLFMPININKYLYSLTSEIFLKITFNTVQWNSQFVFRFLYNLGILYKQECCCIAH